MKPTGKINPLTGNEILRAEESDIDFWDTKWDDLLIDEKAMFCSFIRADYLGKQNNDALRDRYEYYALKNTMEL